MAERNPGDAAGSGAFGQRQESVRQRWSRPNRGAPTAIAGRGPEDQTVDIEPVPTEGALLNAMRRAAPPGSPWGFHRLPPQAIVRDNQSPVEDEDEEEDEDQADNGANGDDDGDVDVMDEEEGEGAEEEEDEGQEEEPAFDPSAVGLKEISNLASFTVSSYKPGCGVRELRNDDVNQFWQSDGPQPHRLNIHFIKRVEIRALRLFLDYELDESYTPTKIQITAGTSPNLTIPFTTMELSMPKGWIDVPVAGAGGGPDGNSLCCWFIRVIVLENHQNGKDTHVRGVKVYALDDSADTAENNAVDDIVEAIDDYRDRMARMDIHDHDEEAVLRLDAKARRRKAKSKKYAPGDGGLSIPDFMRDPEIR